MVQLAENDERDPIALFGQWMEDASASEPNDPNAVALATASPDGYPSVRMVLIKSFDNDGFAFYTNGASRKGLELHLNPKAALCFHWKSLRRQVRVEGLVSQLSPEAADHYFHSRSRASQAAAAVSRQSRVLESRERLMQEVAELTRRYEGKEIPRPEDWNGYLLKPTSLEFWTDGPNRLHDRVLFTAVSGGWTQDRLYP